MPTISVFFGILIRMYYDDHNPPHFHAYYGEHEAIIAIQTRNERWRWYWSGRLNIAMNCWKTGSRQSSTYP